MRTDNRLIDDLTRVASGAFSALSGVREDVEARMREQFEKILSRLDLVTREEFEIVRAMASQARVEQEALAARLALLETKVMYAGGIDGASTPEESAAKSEI